MKKILFSFIAILFSIACYSQTPISGTWTLAGSPYLIEDETIIEDGATLTIEAGVHVIWQNDSSSMFVQGQIVAEGTETDSITFTAANPSTGWKGIRFMDTPTTNDTSSFAYCTFEYARAHGPYPDNCGGAITAMNFGKIIIDHCYFHDNKAMEYDPLGNGAGAIGLWTSSPDITNCLFENNSALLGGAIICYESSDPLIQNNVFTNNSGIDYQSTYGTGYAGGIACITNSHPDIINNTFYENHAEVGGGAILVIYYSNPLIKHNLIYNNTSDWIGGGIEIQDTSSPGCSPIIINNTIADNFAAEGGGIDIYGSSISEIRNTILWGNTATNVGNQVNIRNSNPVAKFYYCDIEDGETGFGGFPPAVYDSCIKSDPLFENPPVSYHLTSGSPCINTGDPTMFDPDGTRCDIGAFYYDMTGIRISDIRNQNSEFRIECWPNPVKGKSEIRYQISEIRNVKLAVYDIHGRNVSTLVNEKQNTGEYTVQFDASDLPDGMYIIRLQAGRESCVGRLLVVR